MLNAPRKGNSANSRGRILGGNRRPKRFWSRGGPAERAAPLNSTQTGNHCADRRWWTVREAASRAGEPVASHHSALMIVRPIPAGSPLVASAEQQGPPAKIRVVRRLRCRELTLPDRAGLQGSHTRRSKAVRNKSSWQRSLGGIERGASSGSMPRCLVSRLTTW